MTEAPPEPQRLTHGDIYLGLALGALPIGLFAVLSFMRPDLMRPMLAHTYGVLFSAILLTFSLAGGVAYVAAAAFSFGSRFLRVLLTLAAFLLCTAPALFVALFAPIVFAFMFGNVAGGPPP